MTERGVNRLPVLNDGTLVGIVSRADLVRAFTRQDDAIRQEITDDVVVQVLRIPAERVQVAVSEGSVTLTGALADQRDTELLVRLAERVPGVVSVRSLLTPPLGDEATP
jgi:osmotically-inducible protein OsmY